MTNELTTAYNKNSASHVYYFGFILAGLLYAVTGMTFDELSAYFKNDRASTAKGGFRKIREQCRSESPSSESPSDWFRRSAE